MEPTNHLDTKVVTSAFSKYNLGAIKGTPEQIKGDVDLNYKITTEQDRVYLLKYIANPDHVKKFEFLGSVYEYLRGKEIPVPLVYKTSSGSFVENSCILYEYIAGEIKTTWSENEITSLVHNFANLLQALKNYAVPDFVKNNDDKYTRGYNIAYCHDIFKPKILELALSENIKSQIIQTIDTLYTKLPYFEKLPKQLVHGDLNEMNALFLNDVNVGIIDFGVSYDPVIYDLGEFCYWFVIPWKTTEFNTDRYSLIVETFEKTLPLSPLEKELLPYMILRRHMMDVMLALQYYWSNQETIPLPIQTLTEKVARSEKIMEVIHRQHHSLIH